MLRFGLHILLSVMAAAIAAPVFGQNVAIVNASFEAQTIGEEVFTNNVVIEWTDSTACTPNCWGVVNPGTGGPGFPSGTVPDGNNALYLVSPANVPVMQVLTGSVLTANTQYSMTLAVGNPADRPDTGSFAFELGVVGSSQNVIQFQALNSSIPNGTFVERTASGAVAAGNIDIGKTLVIRLYGPNSSGVGTAYTTFDNVRLIATPIPEGSTLELLVLGIAALTALRRVRLICQAA